MDKVSLNYVCKATGMDAEEVKALAKERLTYRTDYFTHPHDRLRFTRAALERLTEKSLYEPEASDDILRAKVCKKLPPNDRYIWIRGHDIEGRGTCQIPKRWAKFYRQPDKAVRVRHVSENVYQIVHRDGSN